MLSARKFAIVGFLSLGEAFRQWAVVGKLMIHFVFGAEN